jgi:hypothetical protein
MKKLLATLLSLLLALLPSITFASTQIFTARTTTGINVANNLPLNSFGSSANGGTQTTGPFPIAGTFSNLHAYADIAPSPGNWTVVLQDAGSNEAISCLISASVTSCNDTTHTFHVAAGDSLSMRLAAGSSPVLTTLWFTLEFTPDTNRETAIIGGDSQTNINTTLDFFQPFGFNLVPSAGNVEANILSSIPEAGTIDDLYVALNGSPAAGKSYAFTLRQNSATTTQTCTVADTNSTCNDTTHAVSVVAGDLINLRTDPVGTPTGRFAGWSNRFVNTAVNNDFYYFSSGSANSLDGGSATFYDPMSGGHGNSLSIEGSSTEYADVSQVNGFTVKLSASVASGKSRVITLRKNNADTTCTLTITNASSGSTTCSPVISFDVGDTWDYSNVPSGTPTSAITKIGTIVSLPPTIVPTTSAKHHVWSGFFKMIGGFFRIQ